MTTALSSFTQLLNRWFRVFHHIESLEAPCKLVAIPLELLVEIFKLLTWRDLLQLQRTCRYLAEATKARAIWVHLINEHVWANPLSRTLERPVELYSSKELEQLLLLWKSAELGWQGDPLYPSREHTFVGVKAHAIHLLRGVRWLLVTAQTGAVTYYDLDADTISGVILIPDQMVFGPGGHLSMSIDLDSTSRCLEFTIAFSLEGWSPKQTYPIRNLRAIHIWRINVVLDDTQHGVALHATWLAAFPHCRDICSVMSIALLGSNVALTAITDHNVYTVVIDWTEASRNITSYPWRIVQHVIPTASIYLLPGTKLFTISSTTYSLCNFSSTPATTRLPETPQYSFPVIWETEGPSCMKGSKCFLTEKKASVVVSGVYSLNAITFNYTSGCNELPTTIKLTPLSNTAFYRRASLAFRRTVHITYEGLMTMIGYASPCHPLRDRPPVLRKCLLSNQPDGPEPVVDEESGRVVYSSDGRESVNMVYAVADFARIFI